MNNGKRNAPGRSGEEKGGIDLGRMLRLRLPLMVLVFALIAVPGTVAAWKLVPLEYKASADVRFLASTPRVMNRDSRDTTVPYDKFLNTQVSLITGNAVLSKALADPEVRGLALVAEQSAPLEYLKRVVKADAQLNSELVTISCKLPDRDAAKLLVDRVLAAYMSFALAEEADTGGERLRVLVKERDARQAELDAQLRQVSELQQQLETPAAGTAGQGGEKTSAYQQTHARAEEDVSRASSRAKLLEEQISRVDAISGQYRGAPGKPVFELGVEDKVGADPRIIAARQEYIKADTEFAGVADRYGDKSPQLEVERGKMAALKARVGSMEQSVRGEVISSMRAQLDKELSTTRAELDDAQSRKAGFEGLIEDERRRALDAARIQASVDEMKIHAEETRTLLRAVRDEISSITVESNAPARVKLAAEPSVPATPGFGRRLQALFLVLMVSGTAGLAAGFLRELTDQQIWSAEDIIAASGSPVLAMIPHIKGRARRAMGTLVAEGPCTDAGNEFRKILAHLGAFWVGGAGTVRSCLVTSPGWGDGKTSIACNLAISLAQSGRRVLLMEVSPRGGVEQALGMVPTRGLSEILAAASGPADDEVATLRPTTFKGLFVLGAGLDADMLSIRVASREMAELVEQASQNFDHVIIDTPPFLALAEARLLALMVDGVLLVAGAGVSTLGMVRRASSELRHAGANTLGVVVNCVGTSHVSYMPGVDLYEAHFAARNGRRRLAAPAAAPAKQLEQAVDGARVAPAGDGEGADSGAQDLPRQTTFMEVH